MSRVALLSEIVASQVAAGEVVERPASVVKELVENSLDAQASAIEVVIQRGGIALIRVVDNGHGMDRDDALLCLERHATSKIRTGADLAAISTLGFRGEALPSIASVSRFRLTTREAGALAGTEIIVNGGRVEKVRDCGEAPGTSIEARSLFFNLPARRKFLRAEATEAAHVENQLHLLAIAHPAVRFVYVRDGRTVFALPAVHRLTDRVRDLAGEAAVAELVPIQPTARTSGENGLKISGLLGRAGVSRSTRGSQHIFINGRAIESGLIYQALREGYHTALMKGRYPVAYVFIEMDPAAVDVNVHPAKREVRFREPTAVREALVAAVRRTLEAGRTDWTRSFHQPPLPVVVPSATPPALRSTGADNAPEPLLVPAESGASPDGLVADHAANVLVPPPATERTAGERPTSLRPTPRGRAADLFPASPDSRTFVRPGNPGLASDAVATASPEAPLAGRVGAPSSAVTENADFPPTGDTSRGQPTTDGRNGKFKILGVLNRLYILMENAGGLVLVDQHAAHERILFEELRRRLEADEVPSQKLLLPQTLQLGPRDADWLRQNLPTLQKMGIGLEDFGAGAFKLDSVPPFLQVAEPLALVREIIDSLQSAVASTSRLRLGEEMIAKTVCRHAVKANDRLRERELVKLLEDLMACELPYCCPHGRPTMIELSYPELERKFGRRA